MSGLVYRVRIAILLQADNCFDGRDGRFFDKNVVGTANALAGGWGNSGGGIT